MAKKSSEDGIYRVLSLDGGGAKGFYTLGVLDEIEKNIKRPIHESFDLVFGTSTGAIIAALLARGERVENILQLYREHVPTVMRPGNSRSRSQALENLANSIFSDTKIEDFKMAIGIVATNWNEERPLIFKASVEQAHGTKGSFSSFFGCSVADAVICSCSAYPFFDIYRITKDNGDIINVGDGGFCANNPTLYAIADAVKAIQVPISKLRVISIGVGSYPEPSIWKKLGRLKGGWGLLRHGLSSDFLQKIFGTNTTSMDVLRNILFKDVATIRINDAFTEPTMATDLLEHNLEKLNLLTQKGRISFSAYENKIEEFIK